MKKFDENYVLLEEMARDGYFPGFLVEKVENLIKPMISANGPKQSQRIFAST